jgi:hypothetical protein
VAINGGSIAGSSTILVKATAPPTGNASTSQASALSTTISLPGTNGASQSLTYGTGSGQINVIICQTRTLALSTSETLDINTGLADVFNFTPTMLHLKYIAVYVITGTGDVSGLSILGGASNPFVGYGINTAAYGVTVYPGGPGFQAGEPTVGITVSSGAANIKMTNNSSAASVTYQIVLGGTTT